MESEVKFFPDDPCGKELEWSMKCLLDNGHDSILCKDFVKNYDHCKNFWKWIQSLRRKDGILPEMPPQEEWEHVKNKYLPVIVPRSSVPDTEKHDP